MNEQSPTDETTTSGELISDTIEALRKDEATDTELLDILASHIVGLAPAKTAVVDAARAIEALAAKRGEEPER